MHLIEDCQQVSNKKIVDLWHHGDPPSPSTEEIRLKQLKQ